MQKFFKAFKMIIGSTAALGLAELFGLNYAASAGIITLLTIQDTGRETIAVSVRRAACFFAAAVLSYLCFSIVGYTVWGYGAFLLLFVGVCFLLQWYDAISMNVVLTTHYLASGGMTMPIVWNELAIFCLGAGIGTFLNLFFIGEEKKIRCKQRELEADLRVLLGRMADYLLKEDKSDYTGSCFAGIEEHIRQGIGHADRNHGNTFWGETRYYIDYMQLRKSQCQVLRGIYEKIVSMDGVPEQAKAVSAFIRQIAETFGETNNAGALIESEQALFKSLQTAPLPKERKEFENRAVLYMILKDFEVFLEMKADFAAALTPEQRKKYW